MDATHMNDLSELLTLEAHASSSYAPRTFENAKNADLTVAFAVNFMSAGERLTEKAAAGRLIKIDLRWDVLTSARVLYSAET